jgi:hypothetical protein
VVLMLGVDKKGKFCLDFLGEQWVTKIYAHSTDSCCPPEMFEIL